MMLIPTLVISILWCSQTAQMVVMLAGFLWGIIHLRATVENPANYEPAAKSVALLCQSDPDFPVAAASWDPKWFPPELEKLRPCEGDFSPTGANIGFVRGWGNYGYELRLDNSAHDPTRSRWKLSLRDDDDRFPLWTFTLPKDAHLDRDVFIKGVLREYWERAGDEYSNHFEVGERCRFLLALHEVELARKTIRDFAKQFPQDWLDQLLAFVIDYKADPSAADRLTKWAKSRNNFTGWILAAQAFDSVNDSDSMKRCVKQSLAPGVRPPERTTHFEYRPSDYCYDICARLYELHRYSACASACDALLSFKDDPNAPISEVKSLRNSAIQAAKGARAVALSVPMRGALHPFDGIDFNALGATNVRPSLRIEIINTNWNSINDWLVRSGEAFPKYSEKNAKGLMLSGNFNLEYGFALPSEFALSFSMAIAKGKFPRVYFEGADFYLGESATKQAVFAYGPGVTDVRGSAAPYSSKEEVPIGITIADGAFRATIAGKEISGKCRRSEVHRLRIQSDDASGSGEVTLRDFYLSQATGGDAK